MPRRYYRRTRTIVRAARKKWGSNIKEFDFNTEGDARNQVGTVTLVENSASTATPTPVILKVGNFKVQGDAAFITSGTGRVGLSIYIMYVPEGIAPTDAAAYQNMISAHPEWILAWKYISANASSGGEESNSYSFSSRLKRNLNSGDKVMLIAFAAASANLTRGVFDGVCQYWTCAN